MCSIGMNQDDIVEHHFTVNSALWWICACPNMEFPTLIGSDTNTDGLSSWMLLGGSVGKSIRMGTYPLYGAKDYLKTRTPHYYFTIPIPFPPPPESRNVDNA